MKQKHTMKRLREQAGSPTTMEELIRKNGTGHGVGVSHAFVERGRNLPVNGEARGYIYQLTFPDGYARAQACMG